MTLREAFFYMVWYEDEKRTSRSAVHHREVFAPGAHRLAVLLRHHTGRLCDVTQVVGNPGGQQLAQRDRAKRGMLPLQRELLLGQPPPGERGQVLGAEMGELVEQVAERLALALVELG